MGGEDVEGIGGLERQGSVLEDLQVELYDVVVQISIRVQLFDVFRPKYYVFWLVAVASVNYVGLLGLSRQASLQPIRVASAGISLVRLVELCEFSINFRLLPGVMSFEQYFPVPHRSPKEVYSLDPDSKAFRGLD